MIKVANWCNSTVCRVRAYQNVLNIILGAPGLLSSKSSSVTLCLFALLLHIASSHICPCACVILQLGLKAVYKLESSCAAVPTNCQHPTYTRTTFLQAAQQAVPGMAHDMLNISQRLHRQLSCCGPDTKKQLLDDRDGFMSSVDLQFVTGEHHALVGSVGVLGEPPVHWPSRVEAQLAGLLGDMPTRKFKELRL